MLTEIYPITESHPNETQREESDRQRIATIIQRGHIGHKTSDEIAGEVILMLNFIIKPSRARQNSDYICT